MEKIKAIATMPPYAPYMAEVLRHPGLSGIRLNTVMPIKETHEDLLKRLKDISDSAKKDLWIDLKCRQLRIKDFGVPPFTEIKLSHEIEVYTPCKAYFSGRNESATVLEVDKNRLIMGEGPKRVVGPGESVTIVHPTLKVKGYLTDTDKKYIEAGNRVGINNYMLSFFEFPEDFSEFRKYNPTANVIAKIESQKGLDYVKNKYSGEFRLMAARGDLYMQLHWPHTIIGALEKIVEKDKTAVVASRLFESLSEGPEPKCEEIGDVSNLLRMGYKNFMFGDEVCLKRDSLVSALNLFSAVAEGYE